jgi:hypothetical protein
MGSTLCRMMRVLTGKSSFRAHKECLKDECCTQFLKKDNDSQVEVEIWDVMLRAWKALVKRVHKNNSDSESTVRKTISH